MALEDFERELADEAAKHKPRKRNRSASRSPDRSSKHHRKHHHHHHRSSRNTDSKNEKRSSHHRHRRSRSRDDSKRDSRLSRSDRNEDVDSASDEDEWVEKEPVHRAAANTKNSSTENGGAAPAAKRDAWMEQPSALDIDYVQRKQKRSPPPQHVKAKEQQVEMRIHENELNHRLRDTPKDEEATEQAEAKPTRHEASYTFGDAGSSWRMTKLRAIFTQAKQTGRRVEDIAVERYGDLESFDEAREEEAELDRRKTYGNGYVGKDKPTGEFYRERKDMQIAREDSPPEEESDDEFEIAQGEAMKEVPAKTTTIPLDQTALNKLKAQMMKAKLKGGPEAARLESEYNDALANTANRKQPDVVVLNKMESRMLASGRKGEVKSIDNKRGRERGLVEENEDMSIEDMVRHERRTKGQYGGEGKAFAERIAKDAKFDNDLDYMDENAAKLSKSVHKSDVNLRNTAISDYQKMKHILDTCPLCHQEDTSTPPQAPLVSLATRVYLTLPTSPEIAPSGLCTTIVPIQHRLNLLECDEDEWEEIRNFMKSLSRYYFAQKPPLSVIFYENAAHEGRKRHAAMEAVPIPLKFADNAPAFFREAILAADEEWTQHRKVIDTMAKAKDGGLGKLAFRRTMVSELPYFHVWFTLDGGLGHVVEDARRWPKGDLFAREIIGGILDVSPEVIKRQGRWRKGDAEMQKRVDKLKKGWDKFDWTHVLMDAH